MYSIDIYYIKHGRLAYSLYIWSQQHIYLGSDILAIDLPIVLYILLIVWLTEPVTELY